MTRHSVLLKPSISTHQTDLLCNTEHLAAGYEDDICPNYHVDSTPRLLATLCNITVIPVVGGERSATKAQFSRREATQPRPGTHYTDCHAWDPLPRAHTAHLKSFFSFASIHVFDTCRHGSKKAGGSASQMMADPSLRLEEAHTPSSSAHVRAGGLLSCALGWSGGGASARRPFAPPPPTPPPPPRSSGRVAASVEGEK